MMENDLQALVTGTIMAALLHGKRGGLQIDAAIRIDVDGDYLPLIDVTGRMSGDKLLVRVEVA